VSSSSAIRAAIHLRRGPLRWDRDSDGWPLREHSACVTAAGLEWHVQRYGSGPVALLLHGTGAASHSWRELGPILARTHTVIAPDLPGHGFTQSLPSSRWSLPGVASAIGALVRASCGEERDGPVLVVGHSAGAAIAARATLDGVLRPDALVSLNGALAPWSGPAAALFAPLARVLAATPLVPALFARRAADRAVVERLVGNTGSRLDPVGIDCYARVVRAPDHVAGALQMMANWDLAPLARDLPALGERLLLVVGASDRTVPPRESADVHARVPGSRYVELPALGHLAHEEAPRRVAEIVVEFAAERARRMHAARSPEPR
jgi:magnesium chelatase accessory protein